MTKIHEQILQKLLEPAKPSLATRYLHGVSGLVASKMDDVMGFDLIRAEDPVEGGA